MLPHFIITILAATLLAVLLTLAFLPRRFLVIAASLLTGLWILATCAVVLLGTVSAGWTDGAPRHVDAPRLFLAVLIPGLALIWPTVIIRMLWRARREYASAFPLITEERESARD